MTSEEDILRGIVKRLKKKGKTNKQIKEYLLCEICKKAKDSVRFEGSEEKFICDSCLMEIKNERIRNNQ